jgi:hypothetical protein
MRMRLSYHGLRRLRRPRYSSPMFWLPTNETRPSITAILRWFRRCGLQRLRLKEPAHLYAGVEPRLHEAPTQGQAADGVEQHAALHAIAGSFDNPIAEERARLVGLPDVELKMDMVLGGADGVLEVLVGFLGGATDTDLVSARGRHLHEPPTELLDRREVRRQRRRGRAAGGQRAIGVTLDLREPVGDETAATAGLALDAVGAH